MSRNASEGYKLYEELFNKNINLVFLKEAHIITARMNGKQIGQKRGAKLITKKSKEAKTIILKHSKDFDGNLTDIECIKLAEVSRNTFYIYKKQLKKELKLI